MSFYLHVMHDSCTKSLFYFSRLYTYIGVVAEIRQLRMPQRPGSLYLEQADRQPRDHHCVWGRPCDFLSDVAPGSPVLPSPRVSSWHVMAGYVWYVGWGDNTGIMRQRRGRQRITLNYKLRSSYKFSLSSRCVTEHRTNLMLIKWKYKGDTRKVELLIEMSVQIFSLRDWDCTGETWI